MFVTLFFFFLLSTVNWQLWTVGRNLFFRTTALRYIEGDVFSSMTICSFPSMSALYQEGLANIHNKKADLAIGP